jgi:DNA primase
MTHPNPSTLARDEIDELKARLDLAAIIRGAGIELEPKGKNLFGLCPFHEDDKPSLSVNPVANLWQCFGCRVGGDVYKFLELKEGLKSFPEQLARARQLAGDSPAKKQPKKPKNGKPLPAVLPGGLAREALLEQVANLYAARFKENPCGQEYLAGRGLDSRELWEAFRFGLADGTLRSRLPKDGPILEALRQLGILNERGQEHFHGCLVVPLTHPDFPGVVGFYGRRLDEAEGPGRHRVLAGPLRGVLNWQALQASRKIVLTEGVLDALALWQAGVREVTCLLGSGQLPSDLAVLMERFATSEVVLCLDGDTAGQEGAARLGEAFSQRGLAVGQVALPAGQDPNEVLLRQGPEALKALFRKARPAAPAAEAPECTENGFGLTLGDVSYRVKMVPSMDGRLRARLRVRRGERLHMDRVDLESSRSRQSLVQHLIRNLELSRIEAERHLVALMAQADEWARTHAGREPAQADRPSEMSAAEREEALAFLRHPNLLDRLLEDMEAFGYVGEESGKLLVYLLGISRMLKKPLSGIIRSQSGSGKSSLAELVERLTPPEDVYFCSRISPTALSWVTLDLEHKLIVLEEREGGAGADYQIRTLQSKRRISQLVTQKDEQGQQAADFREVKGPVAFLETTTQVVLNAENLTRCYEIFLDESEEQTRRIQEAQRLSRLPPSRFDPEHIQEAICRRHHNAQRLLERLPVFIPYVQHIRFPTLWLRTRRDNERMLCLIEALALLHQHQREKGVTEDGTAYVLANLDDYRQAYVLTRKVLEQTLHELTPSARDLWALAREYVRERSREAPEDVVFTRRDLRLRSSLMEHAVRAALTELVEMEYAQIVSGCNGKTMFYRLTVLEEEGLSGLSSLTTPDELERLMG